MKIAMEDFERRLLTAREITIHVALGAAAAAALFVAWVAWLLMSPVSAVS